MTVTLVSTEDMNVTSALSQNMGDDTKNDFMPAFKLKIIQEFKNFAEQLSILMNVFRCNNN